MPAFSVPYLYVGFLLFTLGKSPAFQCIQFLTEGSVAPDEHAAGICEEDSMAKQIAVVTGGMGGIGEAISIQLHDAGYAVVVTFSPDNTGANEWLRRMETQGRQFRAYPVDVSDYDSCARCVKRIAADVGPVSILINNAGITRDASFSKLDK